MVLPSFRISCTESPDKLSFTVTFEKTTGVQLSFSSLRTFSFDILKLTKRIFFFVCQVPIKIFFLWALFDGGQGSILLTMPWTVPLTPTDKASIAAMLSYCIGPGRFLEDDETRALWNLVLWCKNAVDAKNAADVTGRRGTHAQAEQNM